MATISTQLVPLRIHPSPLIFSQLYLIHMMAYSLMAVTSTIYLCCWAVFAPSWLLGGARGDRASPLDGKENTDGVAAPGAIAFIFRWDGANLEQWRFPVASLTSPFGQDGAGCLLRSKFGLDDAVGEF